MTRSTPKRRLQFSLFGLFCAVTVTAAILGFLSCDIADTRAEAQAVASLRAAGARVYCTARCVAFEWLCHAVGQRDVGRATTVSFHGIKIGRDEMREISTLKGLKWLNLDDTQVGDCDLIYLYELADLQRLFLTGTRVTDKGQRELERHLAHTRIYRPKDLPAP